MAHNGERNPYIKAAGIIDVVNNIAYNPFGTFSHIDMEFSAGPGPCKLHRELLQTWAKYRSEIRHPGDKSWNTWSGNFCPGKYWPPS